MANQTARHLPVERRPPKGFILMMNRMRKLRAEREEGFTLIELLVVMIIIGILAAIAIPTFLNQRNNGYRATLKADLKNAATQVESYAVDKGGDYTPAAAITTTAGFVASTAPGSGFTISANDSVGAYAGSKTNFCVQMTNSLLASGAETWFYLKSAGSPAAGTCPVALP